MANYKYAVQVLELKEIHEMPEAWTNEDLVHLLNLIEFEDVASILPEELREMTALALSDLEVDEAAIKILELRFGAQLNKGQQQNLAEELKDDRVWEEYPNLKFHEELFNVACILYWAFSNKFPEPDIVRIKLKTTALNKDAISNLLKPTESFLARLLNDGMDQHNLIYRLFDESLLANVFPEAEHIIWKFEESGFTPEENSNIFTVYTSWNWVDELKGVQSYESTAFSDGQLK